MNEIREHQQNERNVHHKRQVVSCFLLASLRTFPYTEKRKRRRQCELRKREKYVLLHCHASLHGSKGQTVFLLPVELQIEHIPTERKRKRQSEQRKGREICGWEISPITDLRIMCPSFFPNDLHSHPLLRFPPVPGIPPTILSHWARRDHSGVTKSYVTRTFAAALNVTLNQLLYIEFSHDIPCSLLTLGHRLTYLDRLRDWEFISVSEEIENGAKWQLCVSDHPAGWAGHVGRSEKGGTRIMTLFFFLSFFFRFVLREILLRVCVGDACAGRIFPSLVVVLHGKGCVLCWFAVVGLLLINVGCVFRVRLDVLCGIMLSVFDLIYLFIFLFI